MRFVVGLTIAACCSLVWTAPSFGGSSPVLDKTFGVAGRASVDLGPGDLAYDTVLQPDGKILLGGNVSRGIGLGGHPLLNYDFAMARFDGTDNWIRPSAWAAS